MNDYSNYHEVTMKDKMLHDGKVLFLAQLEKEGEDVLIDGVPTRGIIHETSNPLNELKEERKFMCDKAITINRGSVVEVADIKYLVTSKVDDKKVYQRAKIVECNYMIPLMVDGIIYNIPSIVSGKSISEEGISGVRAITLPEGTLLVKIPLTETTKNISYNQYNRFIIGDNAWHISNIDKITQQGIINLTVKKEAVNTEADHVDYGIADFWKNKTEVKILNGSSASLMLNDTLQLDTIVVNNGKNINDPTLLFETSDSSIASVSDTGVITAVNTGHAVITVFYNDLFAVFSIDVITVAQDNFTLEILGDPKIKVGNQATFTCLFRNNGVETIGTGMWAITQIDGHSPTPLATIVSQDATSCTIQTNTKLKTGLFWLWVKNPDDSLIIHKEIQVISRF